jgi:hypothetical protein
VVVVLVDFSDLAMTQSTAHFVAPERHRHGLGVLVSSVVAG